MSARRTKHSKPQSQRVGLALNGDDKDSNRDDTQARGYGDGVTRTRGENHADNGGANVGPLLVRQMHQEVVLGALKCTSRSNNQA